MINFEFLAVIRADELDALERVIPAGARILELGGGTGQQARMLAERGFDIVSVDVEGSVYREHRVFPVLDYDGRRLPFADESFDVVLSSNVLEHVKDLAALLAEQARVLRPGGSAVHAMPTHAWRFWTSITHYADLLQRLAGILPDVLPRSLSVSGLIVEPSKGVARLLRLVVNSALPVRHGERGNVISEIAYFHPAWWRREFEARGCRIRSDEPMGLFYTGHMILGPRLGLDARRRLGGVLGSASHLFTISPEHGRQQRDA